MRRQWIVAAAIGVLAALPVMASETCLEGDATCRQPGSGGRSGQLGTGNRVGATSIRDITWSRGNGIIAGTIHFNDGTAERIAFDDVVRAPRSPRTPQRSLE